MKSTRYQVFTARDQSKPVHRRAEWNLAFLTHCPQHQDEPLRHYCLCCHREEPRWIVTREGQDEEVQCWHCGTALHHWPRENIERFSPSLQLTLRLESTLLRSLSGQASCKNDDWSTI